MRFRAATSTTAAKPWQQAVKLWNGWRFTREGKYLVGITCGVGVAAVNTANNLLFLLLGLLLSLIAISGVMSESNLRGLRVTRVLPRRAQVGRPYQVEVEVFNDKRLLPSYAIEIEDLRVGQPADKRCFFLKISPGSTQTAAYRRTPGRRGLSMHRGLRIATRYPFGLFEKSREIELDGTLLVYPAVDPVAVTHSGPGRSGGADHALARGQGDEIMGLRPMRDGDDPRDIYWRRSSQPDQRVLRIRAEETRGEVTLTLDTRTTGPEPSIQWREGFEQRIRDVASRAVAHLRKANLVRVHTTSGDKISAAPAQGADGVLTFLALVEPALVASAESSVLVNSPPNPVPAPALKQAEPSARALRLQERS
jgi:uncharacterized protein (DUF58 family)